METGSEALMKVALFIRLIFLGQQAHNWLFEQADIIGT